MKELIDVIVKEQRLLLTATLQHINISLLAVLIGAAVAIPAGIWLTRNKKTAGIVLGITGVAQTIPSPLQALMIKQAGKEFFQKRHQT